MKYDYRKCKVGDPLWSMQAGEVTLHAVVPIEVYEIQVQDSSGRILTYVADGRYTRNDLHPTLFPEMPKFPEQPQRFEQDQIVSVNGKLRRYAMYSEGKHYIYMDGMSSKSSGHVHTNTFCATDVEAVDLDRPC